MTQAQALSILKTGANVFLTGEPGAGKTYTINAYVRYLRQHAIEPAITASTGIAATHIHGQTIHSWAGIGVRRTLSNYDLETITTTEYLAKRIGRTRVLVIDEVSMIDAQTLSMVEAVCRTVKQVQEPFGGLQVILVGDFFQLPPVTRAGEEACFAFESPAWTALKPITCYLTEQHRQSDEDFLAVLSAIRQNEYDQLHHEHIEKRIITADSDAITEHRSITRLFAHNTNVDELNDTELAKITTPARSFFMQTKGKDALVAALKKGCLSPETLELKVGAIVMCTKNNRERGFVNGTLGTVIGFDGPTTYPIIQTRNGATITVEPMEWIVEESGKIKASITQIPLRLAWAMTIHKSQGMSLDAAVMDLRQVFEYGQGYVALSRVRSLSGLHLLGVNQRTFQVHPRILEKDKQFRGISVTTAEAFAKLSDTELADMQRNFIIAAGGDIHPTKESNRKTKKPTSTATLDLVLEGKTLAQIIKERGLSSGTIITHLEKLAEEGLLTTEQIERLLDQKLYTELSKIEATFKKLDTTLLSPVFNHFKGKYSFEKLRLARIAISIRK